MEILILKKEERSGKRVNQRERSKLREFNSLFSSQGYIFDQRVGTSLDLYPNRSVSLQVDIETLKFRPAST